MTKIKIAVPHVSFEAVKKTVNALYIYKKAGSAKDIKGLANLNLTNTSKALSVSVSLNLVEPTDTRGIYQLTKEGRNLARFLGFNKEKEAKKLLKQTLLECSVWEEIILFLNASIGKPREPLDLVLHVESKLDKNWSPQMRKVLASNYKSILAFAELIDSKSDKLVPIVSFEEIHETPKDEKVVSVDEGSPVMDASVNPEEYSTFSLPNLLIIHVKNTKQAIEFLKNELREDSSIAKWIDLVHKSLEV